MKYLTALLLVSSTLTAATANLGSLGLHTLSDIALSLTLLSLGYFGLLGLLPRHHMGCRNQQTR